MKKKFKFLFIMLITIIVICIKNVDAEDKYNVYAEDKYNVYKNGSIIYFNPETIEKCDDYKEENSIGGVKNGCLKWYTFNDQGDSSSTINLLLDHNTTPAIKDTDIFKNDANKMIYGSSFINGLNQILNNDVSSWNQSLNPRLISLYEVYDAVGVSKDDEIYNDITKSKSIIKLHDYVENPDQLFSNEKPAFNSTVLENIENGWLFTSMSEFTNDSIVSNYGMAYYTSTGTTGDNAWNTVVFYSGSVGNVSHDQYDDYGVRPVITISKNKLVSNDDNQNKTQIVQVGDTLKTSYIGYCIGIIILVLGVMILVQTFRRGKNK